MAKSIEQKVVDSFINYGNYRTFNTAEFARLMAEQDHATQLAFYQSMISFITFKGLMADHWQHELDKDTILAVCKHLRDSLEDYFPEVSNQRLQNMNYFF